MALVEAFFKNGASLILEEEKIKEYELNPVKVEPYDWDKITPVDRLKNKELRSLVGAIDSKFDHTYQDSPPDLDEEMKAIFDQIIEMEGR